MSVAKEQREKLIWEFPNIGKKAPEQEEKAFAYCEGYKEFLNAAKTEREFVREAVLRLKEAGYEEFEEGKIYQPGDKVYQINRKKALLMSTFGKRPLEDGVRINVAHIDSPRLDLKPNPLYEKAEAAYFKTHYYGGIRKYQWATIPLAMHGVVILKDGTSMDICIGEKEGDPVFCVTDLLPHLAAQQNERKLKDGIKGEEAEEATELSAGALFMQGVATSIDALSVGFTISEYGWLMALAASIIIAVVTFFLCMAGLNIGKKFGTELSGKASILGGVILIGIGLEIFISGVFCA